MKFAGNGAPKGAAAAKKQQGGRFQSHVRLFDTLVEGKEEKLRSAEVMKLG